MVVDFIQSNHITSGLVNPESPTYVTGALTYSKGDEYARLFDNINRESYDIVYGDDYSSIVDNAKGLMGDENAGYIQELLRLNPTPQRPLPYEHYGPFRGKGKRLVTGAVISDNAVDMENMLESALPGYSAQEGTTFFFKDGSLVLKNYNFLKHGNVYHAEDGTLAGYDELFNLGEGITYAAAGGGVGAGAGSVIPGAGTAAGAGVGTLVAGLGYASTTELDAYKRFYY